MEVHKRRVIKQNNKTGNARVNVTWRSVWVTTVAVEEQ